MWVFIYIILVHWIADFVLQSRMMGENKSTNNVWMATHCFVYTTATIILWLPLMCFTILPLDYNSTLLAGLFVFLTHFATDYISSRMTTKYSKSKKWYAFFTTIGFDQVVHYTQLFLIYNHIILNN